MRRVAFVAVSILLAGLAPSRAADCADPGALGTARVLVVDPREHRRIGGMQYGETLPLADREVVLTFDDGPRPLFTPRVREALAAECVRATFFVVGRQARAYPDLVRSLRADGHSIGTHSENHPPRFDLLLPEAAIREIDSGIAAAAAALGAREAVAPFFRFPGLRRSPFAEAALAARGVMAWSADMPADDWLGISADEIVARALARLAEQGKGVLLLHDIQPATALALPVLLRELKARGYRVVHVVPADDARPATATLPSQWARHPGRGRQRFAQRLPIASPDSFGWPRPYRLALTDAPALRGSLAADPPPESWPDPSAGPVIAGPADAPIARYALTPRDGAQTTLVAANADAALAAMVRRPRPRPARARVPAPAEAPPQIFGGLFRLPFLGGAP